MKKFKPVYSLSCKDHRQSGFSLVEIMVALVISLFLTIGVIQLFVGTKQTYRVNDALSRLQENGRFAMEKLKEDLLMVGHYGCFRSAKFMNGQFQADPSFENLLKERSDYSWNLGQAIQGYESTGPDSWSPALDASLTTPYAGGEADAITIRSADNSSVPILRHVSAESQDLDLDKAGKGPVRVPAGSNFKACDIVVASSCYDARVFQITGISSADATGNYPAGKLLAHEVNDSCVPGNRRTDLNLQSDYANMGNAEESELMRIITKSYYLRAGADGNPALWRRVSEQEPQELVSGVERMQIRYGICSGGSINEMTIKPPYLNANDIAKWDDVCSVRIDLLLVSTGDRLATTPDGETQKVIFPADTGTVVTIPASDRRLREAFSTTVAIRNRLP